MLVASFARSESIVARDLNAYLTFMRTQFRCHKPRKEETSRHVALDSIDTALVIGSCWESPSG